MDSSGFTPREQEEGQPPPPRVAPDPDNPHWGVPAALGFIILSFVLMGVTQIALLVPYALWRGVPLGGRQLGEFALKDPGAIFVEIISIIPAHLITLGLAWVLVTHAGKYPFFQSFGWEWDARYTFWRSVALAVLLLATGWSIVQIAERFTGPTDNALERVLQSSRAAALATAFAATVTAPLVEEIVFRGILYSALRRLAGAVWAVSIVLLLFALIHVPQYWPSYGVISTILMLSFVLTTIRARTGKLLPCFVIHLVFNSIQAVFIVLNPYLQQFLPPPTTPAPVPAPGLLLNTLLQLFGGS